MKYCIPDCYWPETDNGIYRSHEGISILNTTMHEIKVCMTLYFEDRPKMDGIILTVPAERTIHFHTFDIVNSKGEAIPRGVGYAAVLEADEPIYVQYSRVDTTQKELGLATTMAWKME